MPTTDPSWPLPRLSTDSAEAVACYQRGIAALVAGIAHAETHLAQAVAIDPDFFLAHVGIATARVAAGQPYRAPHLPVRAVSRGERQHAEIVEHALTGDPARALDLRREHLSEYAYDLLVVWLPALAEDPSLGCRCRQQHTRAGSLDEERPVESLITESARGRCAPTLAVSLDVSEQLRPPPPRGRSD